MVPYIAILLLLIAVILFAVFKRVDSFEIGATSLTQDSTLDTFLKLAERVDKQNKATLDKLKSSKDFDDTLTDTQYDDLGILEQKTIKPVSKALIEGIQKELTQSHADRETLTKKVDSGDIKLTTNLKDVFKTVYNVDFTEYTLLNSIVNRAIFITNNRETYVNSKAQPSGSQESQPEDSNNSNVDMEDLYAAVTGTKSKTTADFDAAPEVSAKSSKEMEDRIAKNVATQLKDTLLAERATKNVVDFSCPYAQVDSDATAQGKEYVQGKPAPAPDMSEYIRKDSIPCWNCSLP